MTTKLVVPPMPEFPNPKTLGQRKPDAMLMAELEGWVERIIAYSALGWQTAQREAALADELAEALERGRKMLGPHSLHPDAEGMLMVDCALHTYTAARQTNKEARNEGR